MTLRPQIKVNHEARAANAELRRAQTRARLLETAAAVIAKNSPAAPSVEEFATAAGVSRGTFYNYFETPEALIRALRERFDAETAELLNTAISTTDDAAEQLALMARYFLDFAARFPVRAKAFLHVEDIEGSRRPFASAVFEGILKRGVATGRFRDVDPWAAHALTFGAGRVAMRDIMHGASPPGHGARVTALALTALGLPPVEADQVARRVMEEADAERHITPLSCDAE